MAASCTHTIVRASVQPFAWHTAAWRQKAHEPGRSPPACTPPRGRAPFLPADKHMGPCRPACRGQGFFGLMDEVRIWRTARSQAQILESMRASAGLDNHPVSVQLLSQPPKGSWLDTCRCGS